MNRQSMRRLEINGGRVIVGDGLWLFLPAGRQRYADAQLDDYGGSGRGGRRVRFAWTSGTEMRLRAKFSHGRERLMGTAGFGFWNAPFGDPSVRRPALPQAAWFFYASEPNDLPLAARGQGRGWFASTIDAGRPSALAIAPLAPFVLLMNQLPSLRKRAWPWVRRCLGMSFRPITIDMESWHDYRLEWLTDGCRFCVDDRTLLKTSFSPRGPLGFVCWIDNQFLIATNRGRLSWGVIQTAEDQWLEVSDLVLKVIEEPRNQA